MRITSNEINRLRCHRCVKGYLLVDYATGERFCGGCGLVITDSVEESGPEWHAFSKDEYDDRSRTGLPTSLAMHDMGLATIIGHANKDVTGKPLSSSMKDTIERLRTWDRRSQVHGPADRNLVRAFGEIDAVKSKLALSDAILEKTAYIYRKALEMNLMRGRSISGIAAAALYTACREMETTRTLKEISEATNVKRKEVARCYRILLREMDLKIPVVNPIKCLGRIASKCNLNEKIKRIAMQMLKKAEEMEIMAGKDPMGLAAASLYLSSVINGGNTPQKEIAFAAGMTEVTIRNRYRAFKKDLNL